jgi:hypothetical protein
VWDAADQFRANSGLKSQEYSAPVLGLIFLRFAEVRFAAQRAKLEKAEASSRRGSRVIALARELHTVLHEMHRELHRIGARQRFSPEQVDVVFGRMLAMMMPAKREVH